MDGSGGVITLCSSCGATTIVLARATFDKLPDDQREQAESRLAETGAAIPDAQGKYRCSGCGRVNVLGGHLN
ncbi:MAG: hypothetical protein U0R50_13025 [Gaiellales bacterium]